jgi:hypothetical protein
MNQSPHSQRLIITVTLMTMIIYGSRRTFTLLFLHLLAKYLLVFFNFIFHSNHNNNKYSLKLRHFGKLNLKKLKIKKKSTFTENKFNYFRNGKGNMLYIHTT